MGTAGGGRRAGLGGPNGKVEKQKKDNSFQLPTFPLELCTSTTTSRRSLLVHNKATALLAKTSAVVTAGLVQQRPEYHLHGDRHIRTAPGRAGNMPTGQAFRIAKRSSLAQSKHPIYVYVFGGSVVLCSRPPWSPLTLISWPCWPRPPRTPRTPE